MNLGIKKPQISNQFLWEEKPDGKKYATKEGLESAWKEWSKQRMKGREKQKNETEIFEILEKDIHILKV